MPEDVEVHAAAGEGVEVHAAAGDAGPSGACFEVRAIPGKGMGAIATRDIKLGERVLAEKALFVLDLEGLSEASAAAAVEALDPDQQRQFFELCQDEAVYGATRTPMRIFQNNSLPLGFKASHAGIFPTCARFNHACTPNIHHSWNSNLGMETMHACRDIAKGEELLTSYIQLEETQSRRRKRLLEHFGFTCSCSACSLEGDALVASNERRSKLLLADESIAAADAFEPAMAAINHKLQLLQEEGIGDPCLVRLVQFDAYRVCKLLGKHKEARKWLRKALDNCVLSEGADSPTCQRYEHLLQLPLKAPLPGGGSGQ